MAVYKRPMLTRTEYTDPHVNFTAKHVEIKTFGPDAAITDTDTFVESLTPPSRGDLWLPLTPVVKDGTTGKWRVFEDTDTVVEGFLLGPEGMSDKYHARARMDLTLDTQQRVMLLGEVAYAGIPIPPGVTGSLLEAACANTTRERGIIVTGTTDWH